MNAVPSPSPFTAADAAGCPQCGSDEAAGKAGRRARHMEVMARLTLRAAGLAEGAADQAHDEMAAAKMARTMAEPGVRVAEGAGVRSMLAFERVARVARRCVLMEARAEAGTLGALPAGRAGARPGRPGLAVRERVGGADTMLRQMSAELDAIEKRAGGAGKPAAAERVDEDAEDELLDELGDEWGADEDAEDPDEDFMTGLCRLFSSATEMAKYGARDLEGMRKYLPQDWKPGDPVPPPPPMREMTDEEMAVVRAAYGGPAAREWAAADAVAQDRAPPPGATAISRDEVGPKGQWAFADPEEGPLPVGALRPPWRK